MQGNVESKTIKQLMAEADELIRQINAGVLEEAEEDHRRRFEKHIQALEKIKSEGAGQMTSKGPLPKAGLAEGMHAAIMDIVKAMREFKSNLASRNEV